MLLSFLFFCIHVLSSLTTVNWLKAWVSWTKSELSSELKSQARWFESSLIYLSDHFIEKYIHLSTLFLNLADPVKFIRKTTIHKILACLSRIQTLKLLTWYAIIIFIFLYSCFVIVDDRELAKSMGELNQIRAFLRFKISSPMI